MNEKGREKNADDDCAWESHFGTPAGRDPERGKKREKHYARPRNLSALWLLPFLGRACSSKSGMSRRSSLSKSLSSSSSAASGFRPRRLRPEGAGFAVSESEGGVWTDDAGEGGRGARERLERLAAEKRGDGGDRGGLWGTMLARGNAEKVPVMGAGVRLVDLVRRGGSSVT